MPFLARQPLAGQRQRPHGRLGGLLNRGLGCGHIQFAVVLPHLDPRSGHVRGHQVVLHDEAAQVVHRAVPAARLVEHALERRDQRRQRIHELLALHGMRSRPAPCAAADPRGRNVATVGLQHVLHQLRNSAVLPARQHEAEHERDDPADHGIDQPLAHHRLAARNQQVDLDQHLHTGGNRGVAVLDRGERRAGHERQIEHAQQHQRRMNPVQDADADDAADQRADQAIVVALLGHAEVRLQDHHDGQQDPVAVRRVRQMFAQE
jgi:hypothetical protein